jgi:ribosome-binding protein aMBF1 (putative translation factor)
LPVRSPLDSYPPVAHDSIAIAYPKNEAENLTPKQIAQLAKVVKEEFGYEETDVRRTARKRPRSRSLPPRPEKTFAQDCNRRPRSSRDPRRTSLSQSEFAQLIGVRVKTLQNWEQDCRRPTGPAAALLNIIDHDPALAVKAIHRA